MRFLFYSHDGLGLGHTRRHAAIASALTELAPDAPVLLATGVEEVTHLGLPPNVDTLKLPGLRKAGNGTYAARHLRIPSSEIRALRSALLLTAVKSFRPSVVLVDKHPLGAAGEFREALEAARAAGARAILGLRDILDDPETVSAEWGPLGLPKCIAEYYERVLVYGHPSVFDPVVEYDFPATAAQRTFFCGYVVNREETEVRTEIGLALSSLRDRNRPVVLATVGGGEDGSFLLETFIRAAAGASWEGIVVAGPMTPEHELNTLRRMAAEAKVAIHCFVPNLSALFWSVNALVCMGGYNTLAEALSRGVPTVCVPRICPRREQLLRASTFERLGLLSLPQPDHLNVEVLRQKIQAALRLPRQPLLDRVNAVLSFDGARHAASHLLALASPKPVAPAILNEELVS